ncbi:hypothetical protein [Oricola nitratireducens]|jgi:hypothetical protein|uniref:hypothetical protein n=1 Tax=Oricola nitratireducens TaxID=2775868 RepID=UPI0018660246|nr:hypothetical protein [Oricola nitratireducens]
MALIAGSPGLVLGGIAGAWRWRTRRVFGALVGAAAGFALCLGAVLIWLMVVK